MTTLVTGAHGFLGKALCTELERRGIELLKPTSAECDLTRPDSLDKYNDSSLDKIYHLAAWTQAGDFCLRHPGEQWITNQQINTNILCFWQTHHPQAKLICIGSSCCYEPGSAHKEELFLQGTPTESLYTYAMTKRMLLVGLQALQKQFEQKWLMLVPSTLYGSDYHLDGRQMHFIFDLIRKILLGKRDGSPVVLWGDGHQKRELIHVDDFVQTMLKLDEKVENELVNIGGEREYSIRDFAQLICTETGFGFDKIEYDLDRYVGAQSKFLNTEKLRQLLPDYSPRTLEEGLPPVIRWFEQNLPT